MGGKPELKFAKSWVFVYTEYGYDYPRVHARSTYLDMNTGKLLHKYGHNEHPYALQTRALSRKSIIRKTGAVLVRSGTKYDGLFSREPFAICLWPIKATVFAVVFPVDIPFFDFSIDGNVR